MSRRKPKRNPIRSSVTPLSRRKLWRFRLAAILCVPLLFFVLIELGLRLAGFGYPTGFLLKSSNHDKNTFVQNDQFGWRFFGPRAARQPFATSLPREKSPDTFRIFVFGESAAYGDPQPRFGLPRMLEATLGLRHPGKKFEVVNVAMTGINSHVILPLARDCEQAKSDIWVIYMGNNEVVGPFGAGTVFGSQTLSLPLIRAGLALKATKTGQLFDALRVATEKTSGNREWEGMRMFVEHKLASDDARLGDVYANFEKNLKDIIASGRNSGAKIVLSTVAVNLKDCAPFASLHHAGLTESRLNDWQRFFDAGVKAQASGDFQQAAANFDQAQQIDDSFAELLFRRGQCALALNDAANGQKEFAAARDLDALRFRCDSHLNDIIRQQSKGDVTLADGEQTLANASPGGISGDDFFYEHVHLTFQGNHLLARTISEKVEQALGLLPGARWPDISECAQSLGYTPRDTQLGLSIMLGRLADVPFTFQANHAEQILRLTEAAGTIPPPDSAASLRGARSAAEVALERRPDDAELWEQLGEIKARGGDYAGAIVAVQRSLDLVPSRGPECWLLYGTLLAQEKKYDDAIAAFKRVNVFYSRADWAGYNLALCLDKLGRRDEAVAELKRVLVLYPNYSKGWLTLGQLHEQMGRTNDAAQSFNKALTNRVNQVDDIAMLARFSANRRWFGLAVTNYAAAIKLSPSDPGLRMEIGRVLVALGRRDEAVQQYQVAAELVPELVQPHMQLGFELGRLDRPALAEREFREVLRLDPNLIEARVALGVTLYDQKKFDEAREQFEAVLKRNPTDETALQYARLLRNRTPLPTGH